MKTTETTATSQWYRILSYSLAVLLLAGCEKNEFNPEADRIRVQPSINDSQRLQTRVTESDKGASTFEKGDEIGVFVVNNTVSGGVVADGELLPANNHADNVKHILAEDGSSWQATGDMFWSKSQSIYLTAYYPYIEMLTNGITDMSKVPFQVKINQSQKESGAARTNYQLSDLLWARSANVSKTSGSGEEAASVDLKFNHILSKATINLKFNDEFKDPISGDIEIPSAITVSVVGTNTKALLNFCSAVKAAPSYRPDPNWEDNKDDMTALKAIAVANAATPAYDAITPMPLAIPTTGYNKTFQAIVVPQIIQSNTLITIKTTVNGKEKSYNYTPASFEFKSGLHHIFNITVGSYDLTVSTGSLDGTGAIIDWNDGDDDSGDTEAPSLFKDNYWATANLGTNTTDQLLGKLYPWTATPCPAGYRLPTTEEYAAILPTTSTSFDPAASSTSGEDQYYADGSTTIYGIKEASDNTRYWIRWQYLTTTTATPYKYLRISYWADKVDNGTNLPATGSDAEKLSAIKAMLPKSQPQTLVMPAASPNAEGNYWSGTQNTYIRFNANAVNPPATTAGNETYSVRCIQKHQ